MRRLRLTDRYEDWLREKEKLLIKLILRNYPFEVIMSQFDKINFSMKNELRSSLATKIMERRNNLDFPMKPVVPIYNYQWRPFEGTIKIPLIIRYDPQTLHGIKQIRKILNEELNLALIKVGQNQGQFQVVNAFTVGKRIGDIISKK